LILGQNIIIFEQELWGYCAPPLRVRELSVATWKVSGSKKEKISLNILGL